MRYGNDNPKENDKEWGRPNRRKKEIEIKVPTGEVTKVLKRVKYKKVTVILQQGPRKLESLREFMERIDGSKVAKPKKRK